MPKIIIKEADFTSEVIATDLTNAAYIPGFSINPVDGEEAKYELGVPTLYTDVDSFIDAIGDRPFFFGTDATIGEWSEEGVYAEFQVVAYGGKYYVNTTGQNRTAPDDDEDQDWETNTIDAWDDDATYGAYTMVSYKGVIYVNKSGANTGAPNVDTNDWATNSPISGAGKYDAYGVNVGCDLAYIYAKTLLGLGLPIYYEVVESINGVKCATVEELYQRFVKTGEVESIFDKLSDKGSYSIKYITSGGYPIYNDNSTTSILHNMVESATQRADTIALVDHKQGLSADPSAIDNAFNTLKSVADSVFDVVPTWSSEVVDGGSYAAMFTPWATYTFVDKYEMGEGTKVYENNFEMPASFAYMVCLANSIKNNPDWLAIAGVTRGKVAYIDQKGEKPIVTNREADSYMTEGGSSTKEGRSINGITNIRPYGLTIWGNRTLVKNTQDKTTPALAYLNTRNMVSDVKKVVFEAAQKHMFEQNNDVLWINFKSDITPLLDRLSTSGGISGYKIIKQKSKTSAKLCATIILYPIYAVEEIEVSIELRNEDITVA